MTIVRIQQAFQGKADPRFTILYGIGIEDIYIDAKLRELNIEQALHAELRRQKFNRILFLSPHRSVYSLDPKSEKLSFPSVMTQAPPPEPDGPVRMARLVDGPLADLHLLPRMQRRQAASGSSFQGMDAQPVEAQGPASNGMADIFSIRLLDAILKDPRGPRSAIVLVQAETILRYFEDQHILAGILGEWARLPSNNPHRCIFLFAANDETHLQELAGSLPVPELREWITGENADSNRSCSIRRIDGPELEEMVRLVRLRQREVNLPVDEQQAARLCQRMVTEGGRARVWLSRLREIERFDAVTARQKGWFSAYRNSELPAKDELDALVGLGIVKQRVHELTAWYKVQNEQGKRRKRKSAASLNFIFTGNPGTGKTTVARLIGEMFAELGILKKGHLVEVNGSDLIADHVGGTALKTNAVVDQALDGVLFVDEAYALSEGERGGFAQEALDTLMARLEDERSRLVVVLAGYPRKMDQLLRSNPGLSRRFPLDNRLEFPDYSPEELGMILDRMLAEGEIGCPEAVRRQLIDILSGMASAGDESFGNAGEVRNLVDSLERTLSARLYQAGPNEPYALELDDIPGRYRTYLADQIPDVDLILSQLNELVGLETVKSNFRTLVKRIQFEQLRKGNGKRAVGAARLQHLVFVGNPGTGKTTVARYLGQIYQSLGLLRKGHLVEVSRADLVAGYVGQTALKTREKINEALDGVLFIDEAYSLHDGGPQDFGKEAVNVLVEAIEKQKNRLLVVLAGYPEEMDAFLEINPGLRSRFAQTLRFPDYSEQELLSALGRLAEREGYVLPQEVKVAAGKVLRAMRKEAGLHFGNIRSVENLFQDMQNALASRLMDAVSAHAVSAQRQPAVPELDCTFTVQDLPRYPAVRSRKKPKIEANVEPKPAAPRKAARSQTAVQKAFLR